MVIIPPPPHNEIETHERYWNWIFSVDDGPTHPLKISSGGEAQESFGNVLIVAGSLRGDGRKERSLRIDAGIERIFVPAESVVYTEADGDGPIDQDLLNNVQNDIRGAEGIAYVLLNDSHQKPNFLGPHLFSLNIQKCIKGTGRSGVGEGCTNGTPPGITRAAAACYYVFIPTDNLKTGSRIELRGRDINVTYTVR